MPAAPGPAIVAAYTYDALSRRTRVDLGNGASTAYTYNLSDKVSRIEHSWHQDGTTLDYTYNRSDLVTSLTVADPRFKPWFGPAGETDFTPNTLNQYTQAGSTTLAYTTAGNLQSDGTRGFSYDSLNRLRVSGSADITQGPSTAYGYDALGRRVSKTFSGISTAFLYAGDRIIGEYSSSGQLTKRFIYGPGIDEPVAMILVNQGAETTYYYHADRLGSVIGLTNQNGDLVESYHYTPYGQPYKASSLGNPFLFTGREYDAESGLYHYRARAYDPTLRRFLQPDPIGFADSMNLYGYVRNNPGNWVDPFGLETRIVIGTDKVLGVRFGHVGIWVENSGDGQPMIYDPSGSYNELTRGSGGIFFGKEADWNSYLEYQGDAEIYTFDTTLQEEKAIADRAIDLRDPRGLNCSDYVSSAVSGIGPFRDLKPTMWPGSLANQLRKLQKRFESGVK